MRRISTFKTLAFSAAFALAALTSNSAVAQQQTTMCGITVEDFSTDAGGFTSNLFTYSATDGNMQYVYPKNINTTTVLTIQTPTYVNPNPSGVLYVGFDISGYTRGSSYKIDVYTSAGVLVTTSGEIELHRNDNSNKQSDYACHTFTGVGVQGQAYYYVITVNALDPKGNGNKEVAISFDDFSLGNIEPIILPVNFKGINARMHATSVKVQWNVAQEIDVKEYVVERSADGKGFAKVGAVAATGSDVYSFADAAPVNGVSFYRVKSVDIDGKTKYSTIVRINNSKSVALRAYPSPANNQVAIEHEALSARGKITISTADGKAVVAVNALEGTSQTVIDLSKLNSGIYLVRLEKGNGQVESLKFVKL